MGISLMIELPEELVVMEILSKLPAKSLVRLACVSKHWASSFQTSHFITKHYLNNNHNNLNLNLLLKRSHGETRDDEITYFSALSSSSSSSTQNNNNNNNNKFEIGEDIEFPVFKDFLSDPVIDGPCNGLLCLSDGGRGGIALWNPSTREFKHIPKSTVPRRGPSSESESESDPCHHYDYSFGCLGFGYDGSTTHDDDYKIVRFVDNSLAYRADEDDPGLFIDAIVQVELYSLKSDSWKQISPPEERPWGLPLFNNYINGRYYWLASASPGRDLILSFDFADEKFSTFPLPHPGVHHGAYLDLLDFNGLLGAFVYPREGIPDKYLDLWVMDTNNNNNNNGSWTKQFSIEPIPGVERPLGFWTNGEIFLESSNDELMLFDPATREVKNLGIDSDKRTMQLIVYAESLVPINGRPEQEERIVHHPPGHLRHQFQLDIQNKEKTTS